MGEFKRDRKPRFGGRDSERSGGRFGGRDSERSGSSGGRFGRRDSGPSERFGGGRSFERSGRDRDSKPEMHDITCDKCGKESQVPFKPTSSKPVYCSDCFKTEGGDSRGDRGSRSSGPSVPPKELAEINEKLDKILKALDIE